MDSTLITIITKWKLNVTNGARKEYTKEIFLLIIAGTNFNAQ